MKLSVFYHHILEAAEQSGKTVGEILSYVAQAGVNAVELEYSMITNGKEELLNSLKQNGMSISCVFHNFAFEKHYDDEYAGEFLDEIASVGVERVLAVAGYTYGNEYEQSRQKQMIAEGLNSLCEAAKTRNITVTLEDYDYAAAPFSTIKGLLYFLEEVPDLRITFDTGNFMYSCEDELEAFEKLKHKIVHVHCKDRALLGAGHEKPYQTLNGIDMFSSPVGSGCIKIEEIIKRLKEQNYDGYYTIEHFAAPNQLNCIMESVRWLKERI